MKKLENIKCFLLDMDGTIYLGNELRIFRKIKRKKYKIYIFDKQFF